MKAMYWFSVIALFCACSCGNRTQPTDETQGNDVIKTESGLSYSYTTRGDGNEVEPGSEVSAYLNLVVNDSVVWNTNELPNQLFVFKAGDPNLIKGFNEIALLLREGDEISVTIPANMAYGEKGTPGFVPPNTPITYAPFRVEKVSSPIEAEPADSIGAQ